MIDDTGASTPTGPVSTDDAPSGDGTSRPTGPDLAHRRPAGVDDATVEALEEGPGRGSRLKS